MAGIIFGNMRSHLMNYKYFPDTNMWRMRMLLGAGEIEVCGRSEHPTDEQKHLLEVFLPLLLSLTQASLERLEKPEGVTASDMPRQLELDEVRFESSGDVELFFSPSLEIDGYDAWPKATCSADGQLLYVGWTV